MRSPSIVQGGQALSYSLANLDSQFKARFPGYGYTGTGLLHPVSKLVPNLSGYDTRGPARRRTAGATTSERAVRATSLRSMAQTTDGRLEALQVMGQISEQQVQQLMKLRELMMADMSSKQSYQAAIIQKQAASEAATERFFNWTPEVSDKTTFQSGWK